MNSPESFPFDAMDEPRVPSRSPSRLNFCLEDLDDSPTQESNWATTSCSHTPVDEGSFTVNIAPLDHPSPLIVDPLPHTHETADLSHAHPPPPEDPIDHATVEPWAPIPLRPPPVQLQVDAREPTSPPCATTQRLRYPHHGFSRSALLQQKILWNSRYEEWAEWQSRREHSEAHKQESVREGAYTGIAIVPPRIVESPPPYMRAPPSGLERDLTDHPPRKHEQAHLSIFPRVGDISALRDPYSVNIDRCFFRYPLWTLHKTLYVFNMHQRSAPFTPSASTYHSARVQSSMSSSTLSSYTSSSADDEESDSTLVADDSPVTKDPFPLDPAKHASSPHGLPPWSRLCGWELSWYARWELLIGLFQRDCIRSDTHDVSTELAVPLEFKTGPLSPAAPIFGHNVGEGNSDDDDDEDEDEDYGTLVPNSRLSMDLEEECGRAMAFYSREPKCLELVL